MTQNDIFFLVLLVLRWIIGISLIRTALRDNMKNLTWLGYLFIVNGFVVIFGTSFLPMEKLLYIGLAIAQIFLVIFIKQSFYEDKKSIYPVLMPLTVLSALGIIYFSLNELPVGGQLLGVIGIINWGWHGVAATEGYRSVAQEKLIEDWVKSRYRMMIGYAVLMMVTFIVFVFPAIQEGMGIIVMFLAVIVGVILQFLVWIMPEKFRLWLNRNQAVMPGVDVEELSEEELIKQMTEA